MLSFSKLTRCSRNSPGYLTLAQILKNSLRLFYGNRRLKPYIQEPGTNAYVESEETRPNKTKPGQTTPNQTKQDQTRPNKTKPDQTRPKPDQPRPNKPKQDQTRPHKTNPDQTLTTPTAKKILSTNDNTNKCTNMYCIMHVVPDSLHQVRRA
jgi:hypothetical protein